MMQAYETAVLGGGCFWCIEAAMARVRGVASVCSGYAGGEIPDPTYEAVCSGSTGHAEIVIVEFDPGVINFEQLLDLFFALHDPTTLNRQGADVGTQYRSVIFPRSETQKAAALDKISELDRSGRWADPLVTTVEQADTYYEAEEYHRDYAQNNPQNRYCQLVVEPKLQKFFREHSGALD